MALNNPYDYYFKVGRKLSLIAIVLLIIGFNMVRFCQQTSVNAQKIVEYQSPEDILAHYRNPLIAGYYYQFDNGVMNKPRMAIIPQSSFVSREKIVKEIFQTLNLRALDDYSVSVLVSNNKTEELIKIIRQISGKSPILVDVKNMSAQEISRAIEAQLKDSEGFVFWDLNLEADVESAIFLAMETVAKNLNLLPHLEDLLKNDTITATEDKQIKNEEISLNQQLENLQMFKKDYRVILQQFIEKTIEGQDIHVYPEEETLRLWDKGAVLTAIYDPQKQDIVEFGQLQYNRPLIERMVLTTQEAVKSGNEKKIQVLLLTEPQEKKFEHQSDFAEELVIGEDGVMLVYGSRQGRMSPLWWKIYPNKQDFIKQLKIKAGLSPDFWSEEIKIYLFKAIEITDYGN